MQSISVAQTVAPAQLRKQMVLSSATLESAYRNRTLPVHDNAAGFRGLAELRFQQRFAYEKEPSQRLAERVRDAAQAVNPVWTARAPD
jgi:hypothetical protein